MNVARTLLIARRELSASLSQRSVWLMCALVVALDGVLFNAFALGPDPKPSSRVLEELFQITSATTMVFAIFTAMRLFVEERDRGSLVLLLSSPAHDVEIVLGKFLGSFGVLSIMLLCTLHLPLLVLVHGTVSVAHLTTGYIGLFGLGAVSLSLGLLGSVLARSQLVAGLLGAGMLVTLLIGWLLARISDAPMSDVLSYLALWQTHFQPLMRGILALSHLIYFASVITAALAAATLALGASRWV